jgi:hypothetical protein
MVHPLLLEAALRISSAREHMGIASVARKTRTLATIRLACLARRLATLRLARLARRLTTRLARRLATLRLARLARLARRLATRLACRLATLRLARVTRDAETVRPAGVSRARHAAVQDRLPNRKLRLYPWRGRAELDTQVKFVLRSRPSGPRVLYHCILAQTHASGLDPGNGRLFGRDRLCENNVLSPELGVIRQGPIEVESHPSLPITVSC